MKKLVSLFTLFLTVVCISPILSNANSGFSIDRAIKLLSSRPQPGSQLKVVAIKSDNGSTGYTCDNGVCECDGDDDCDLMFTSGDCNDLEWCDADSDKCYCRE